MRVVTTAILILISTSTFAEEYAWTFGIVPGSHNVRAAVKNGYGGQVAIFCGSSEAEAGIEITLPNTIRAWADQALKINFQTDDVSHPIVVHIGSIEPIDSAIDGYGGPPKSKNLTTAYNNSRDQNDQILRIVDDIKKAGQLVLKMEEFKVEETFPLKGALAALNSMNLEKCTTLDNALIDYCQSIRNTDTIKSPAGMALCGFR
ncbi:MAG TPA: hypothetical protein VHL08_06240 [Dongiaceae bacterium]|nr:hypothetical protein [Dongiaceae bacterium]